jgi:hypothetical protein
MREEETSWRLHHFREVTRKREKPEERERSVQVNQQWKISGDYFEACNCESTCPCIFLADPDEGDCQLALAWHVAEGLFGSTPLDGLSVVGIIHAPGNMLTGPKWRAAFYFDERATTEQREALRKIYSGEAGGFWANIAPLVGEQLEFRFSPIHLEVDGRQRWVQIPGVLELKAEGTQGADHEKEAVITNPALYAAPGFDPVIARSTQYTYEDHGMAWNNSGRNAFYSKFEYAG